MKKMDKRLKILLGVLLTIFVILIVVFIANLRKKEEEPTDNGSYVEPYDREKLMFLSHTYKYWEDMLLKYYRQKLGYEPSLYRADLNEKNDLVITFKNYDSSVNKEEPILIDIVTINHITEKITDKDGNEIVLNSETIADGEINKGEDENEE